LENEYHLKNTREIRDFIGVITERVGGPRWYLILGGVQRNPPRRYVMEKKRSMKPTLARERLRFPLVDAQTLEDKRNGREEAGTGGLYARSGPGEIHPCSALRRLRARDA
jgi:hypothetical protein